MSKLIDAMKQVNDLNKTHGVTQRGGKKYTEVFVRVEAFRQAFGTDLGIDTQILVDDGKRVVVKATILGKEGLTVGSGLAEEIRGQGNVNKTSALENARRGWRKPSARYPLLSDHQVRLLRGFRDHMCNGFQ